MHVEDWHHRRKELSRINAIQSQLSWIFPENVKVTAQRKRVCHCQPVQEEAWFPPITEIRGYVLNLDPESKKKTKERHKTEDKPEAMETKRGHAMSVEQETRSDQQRIKEKQRVIYKIHKGQWRN